MFLFLCLFLLLGIVFFIIVNSYVRNKNFSGLSPLSSKKICPPPPIDSIFGRSYLHLPPLIRDKGGGSSVWCLVCIVDQTQNFQEMFQVLCCIFILIKKEEGSPKQSRCLKLLNFLVDCSIIDANFCNPYLWYLMHSERCTPIVRHGNFRLCQIFILINKVEGSPKYYGI